MNRHRGEMVSRAVKRMNPHLLFLVGLALFVSEPARCDELANPFSKPGYDLRLSAGFLHTGGDVTSVWRNGFILGAGLAYNTSRSIGLEFQGDLGYTGMTERMKNKVRVYIPSTGTYGDRESTGGTYFGLGLGPQYRHHFGQSRLSLHAGVGAHYYGEQESGMDNIKGYTPRWTFGWGYYLLLGSRRVVATGRIPVQIGVQARYSSVRAKVNDFYYDRVYGEESYDAIPATYETDVRVALSLDLTFRL